MSTSTPSRLDRRTAIKWMLTASAAMTVGPGAFAAGPATARAPATKGYGTDPLLNREYAPGSFWPLTMTDAQRRTAAALCGLIIPAEGNVPGADDLKVHDFIDEWISAPYPDQQRDRPIILAGLEWIDAEAQSRFAKPFANLDLAQMSAIADDICHEADAKPGLGVGAVFFARDRDLTAGAFYSTPEGMKDIGYVGNMPLIEFKGPPREVLERLGIV
ncbi:MAG TPA: gluconate 2-dehydrogenase subunit 3 family protein [Lacunisphaera sp.]|nr:gluconate 2-dehydrogenase subunit 3 family protein [Lacunisphaera sp.]